MWSVQYKKRIHHSTRDDKVGTFVERLFIWIGMKWSRGSVALLLANGNVWYARSGSDMLPAEAGYMSLGDVNIEGSHWSRWAVALLPATVRNGGEVQVAAL